MAKPFEIVRVLQLRHNGRRKKVKLIIGNFKLLVSPDKANAWTCSWSMPPTDPTLRYVCGEDALDALQNCMIVLKEIIAAYEHTGTDIWWLEPGDQGGLLVGETGGGDALERLKRRRKPGRPAD
jgi:hypothetical protein